MFAPAQAPEPPVHEKFRAVPQEAQVTALALLELEDAEDDEELLELDEDEEDEEELAELDPEEEDELLDTGQSMNDSTVTVRVNFQSPTGVVLSGHPENSPVAVRPIGEALVVDADTVSEIERVPVRIHVPPVFPSFNETSTEPILGVSESPEQSSPAKTVIVWDPPPSPEKEHMPLPDNIESPEALTSEIRID